MIVYIIHTLYGSYTLPLTMPNPITHLSALFEHNPQLGAVLLVVLLVLLVLIVRRKWFGTRIDINGRVIHRSSIAMPVLAIIATAVSKYIKKPSTAKQKPYAPRQRKALYVLYTLQEAFFGLVVFSFGLIMFIAAMLDISDAPHTLFHLLPVARIVVSVLTMLTGILLVYFRNIDNPFDDS